MSPHAYSEDQLVEQPAIALFAELGWETVAALEETFGPAGTFQRATKHEVVLAGRLRSALERLNPTLPPAAITAAIDELTRDRSAMLPEHANRDVYDLLKEGISVSLPDLQMGGQKVERLRVIDWAQPANNDFLLVSQFSVAGPLYTCRPDLVGFVNGLPLVVIELKKPAVPARAAFADNLTHYKQQIPALFRYNALLIASNGADSRVGSLTADWERYFEWKRIAHEGEPRRVSLEVMIRGTCAPAHLLDIVENFILFSEHKAGLVKVIGQNHQYLGVNNAIAAAMQARRQGHGRGGVFWQTQGSGKSFSMIFFAQKIQRRFPGDWTFVIVTDRAELDTQIAATFKATGAVSESEGEQCHAASGAHLRELLRGNHRYVFTLIHKFQTAEELCDRRDVIVLTDEAHRSQYDTLALNMRSALPNALFLAFTGTPLIAGEERTREVFGDYVSIYDFQQSVEDGSTVRLFYENRTPELELTNPDLNDDIYALIDEAELSEEAERRLERVLGKQYHILTRDDRLETVAADIVQHFLGRGFAGKAMVVSIDKATALRMHDKVRKHWAKEQKRIARLLAGLEKKRARSDSELEELAQLRERMRILTSTDMALVVSPGQNEIEQMRKLGLDIAPHRQRMNDSAPRLDERFKDPDDPLRLVFVCAMWLTGFDAPSCSTVYLDKPMRNHSLMQAIARANRVYPGKQNGLIIDYANVFSSLERALAIYGAGTEGRSPVRDKSELVEELRQAVAAACAYCMAHGVQIAVIEHAPAADFARADMLKDAINLLASPDPLRKEFLAHARLVHALYRAIKPDPAVAEFAGTCACLAAIADGLRLLTTGGEPIDISPVMGNIRDLLDRSIAADGFQIVAEAGDGDDPAARPGILDLARIDFAALADRFKQARSRNIVLEKLKAAIRAQLERMIRINRTRVDYLEKFERLIAAYNAGSRNIDELFEQLLTLSRSLSDEQERHIRENLSEEELTIFDILTRPDPGLNEVERAEVKKVARLLLERLQTLLVLDWRNRAAARAQVLLAIEDLLDQNLPDAYTPDFYRSKCQELFHHIYEQQSA